MKFYVSKNWVAQMNTDGFTNLYTQSGEKTDALVTINFRHGASPTKPMIYNLFEEGDHFPLVMVEKSFSGGMYIEWRVNKENLNFARFNALEPVEEPKTKWCAEDEDEDDP